MERLVGLAFGSGQSDVSLVDLVREKVRQATQIPVRREQTLQIDDEAMEPIYFVGRGVLFFEFTPSVDRRRILKLFFPGDVVACMRAPALPGLALVAGDSGEVLRVRGQVFFDLVARDEPVSRAYHDKLSDQQCRMLVHAGVIGGIPVEERVAMLLVEIGLRLGAFCSGGVSFDMPLSRSDVADYLAVNADTVSRVMSRLKYKGLIAPGAGRRIVVPDWQALMDESPLSVALQPCSA